MGVHVPQLLRMILFVLVVIGVLLATACAELDEKLIEKDLYHVLGVDPNADLKEIKQKYRKLAKIHHPDSAGRRKADVDSNIKSNGDSEVDAQSGTKSSSSSRRSGKEKVTGGGVGNDAHLQGSPSSSKEVHEAMFRDIAEAYEVLSSADSRAEYDYLRARREKILSGRGRAGGRGRGSADWGDSFDPSYIDPSWGPMEGMGGAGPDGYDRYQMPEEEYMQHMFEEFASMFGAFDAFDDFDHRSAGGRGQRRDPGEREGVHHREQQRRHQHQRQEQYHQKHEAQGSFDPFVFPDHDMGGFQTVLTGPILPEGQVMFPVLPLVTSFDQSHFAMLDAQCSLGVFKGNAQQYARHLFLTGDTALPDPSTQGLPFKRVFSTDPFPQLNGHCFAGLDNRGLFAVFAGDPYNPGYFPVWTSAGTAAGDGRKQGGEEEDEYSSVYKRYYLELSDSGDWAVRSYTVGYSEPACVWSTLSCNHYRTMLRTVRRACSQSAGVVASHIQDLIDACAEAVDLVAVLAERTVGRALQRLLKLLTLDEVLEKVLRWFRRNAKSRRR